jgi:tetratricopeptide (TPR) repeat protein
LLNKGRRGRSSRGASARANPLGTRIRQARQELGLTLRAVAGKDFSRAFLNQVELGRSQPSMHNLRIIAERLHRPIEFFLQDPEVSSAALELTLVEAETRLRLGDPVRAEALIRELLKRSLPSESLPRAQLILGTALQRRGAAAESADVLNEALKIVERSGFKALTVEIYDALSRAYYLQRRAREAERWLDRALELYDSSALNDPVLKARLLGHRANLHYVNGAPGEAIAAYESAIASAEQGMDMPALAGIYQGLALSFQQTGQFERALNYAQRSLRIVETMDDVRMSAQLHHNMAEMLLRQARAAEAEPLFLDAAARIERIGDRDMLPLPLAGAAEAALELGALERAEQLVARALNSAPSSSDPVATIASYRVAGRIAHALGRAVEAHDYFERALREAERVDSPEVKARIRYDYARALEAEGDTQGAALRFREAYESRVGSVSAGN